MATATTKISTTTTRTTTTGIKLSRRALFARSLPLLLVPAGLPAADKKEKEKKLAAVIAGTVFRDPGFAVAGASVELIEIRADGKKAKSRKIFTDGRGEFAFPVPPQEMKYKVKASARGLEPAEKDTESIPGARVDVFFTLKPVAP